jgi:glycine cleavage system transcriptional repressor
MRADKSWKSREDLRARDVTGATLSQASIACRASLARIDWGSSLTDPGSMKQFLAISALGKDRPGLAHDFVRTIADCGASISESRMLPLGGELAMQVLASGNWHAVARVESELTRFAETGGLALQLRRTEPRALREEYIPYSIDVIGPDQSGIVAGIAGFLTARHIEIAEVASRTYAASQTGAAMFTVQMMINVPVKLAIAQLREDFMEYCDSKNLDAILEPVKN